MKNRLRISEHAEERLRERYGMPSNIELVGILGNTFLYITIDVDKNGKQTREVFYYDVQIQYVVLDNTVLTFIPVTFAQNETGEFSDLINQNDKLRRVNRLLADKYKTNNKELMELIKRNQGTVLYKTSKYFKDLYSKIKNYEKPVRIKKHKKIKAPVIARDANNKLSSINPPETKPFRGDSEYNIKGQRFGKFLVIGYLGKASKKSNKGTWLVKCDCGIYENKSSKALKSTHVDNVNRCESCRDLVRPKRKVI